MSTFKTQVAFGFMSILSASVAFAEGAVIDEQALGEGRAAIAAKIATARVADPEIFRIAASVGDHRSANYLRTRSRRPERVGLVYRRMGARALWALVDLAAFHAPDRGSATDGEWNALRAGLVDAIGVQRDPILTPFFRAIFLANDTKTVTAAAAIGLAHIGDAALPTLLAHAQPSLATTDPRYDAAVQALGESHRPEAMQRLVSLLDATHDETQAANVANAIAEAASPWVWATGQIGTKAEELAVRANAQSALSRNRARFTLVAAVQIDRATQRLSR